MAGSAGSRWIRLRPAAFALVVAAAFLAGCATTGSATRGGNGQPSALPCPDGAGASAEMPVSARTLSTLADREILVCPGGAIAGVAASARMADNPSSSVDGTCIMTIACPDAEYRFHVDSQGPTSAAPACVPSPFTVLPSGVSTLIDDSTRELSAGDFKSALRLAAKASKLNPESEAVLIALGTARMANRQFKEAESTLASALEINPGSVAVRLAHAVCLSEIGEKAMYAAEIFRLYDEIPVSDPLHWDLTCRVADNFNRIGNRQEAIRLARVACDHGVAMCCDLAHSDIDAREIE